MKSRFTGLRHASRQTVSYELLLLGGQIFRKRYVKVHDDVTAPMRLLGEGKALSPDSLLGFGLDDPVRGEGDQPVTVDVGDHGGEAR